MLALGIVGGALSAAAAIAGVVTAYLTLRTKKQDALDTPDMIDNSKKKDDTAVVDRTARDLNKRDTDAVERDLS